MMVKNTLTERRYGYNEFLPNIKALNMISVVWLSLSSLNSNYSILKTWSDRSIGGSVMCLLGMEEDLIPYHAGVVSRIMNEMLCIKSKKLIITMKMWTIKCLLFGSRNNFFQILN